MEIDLASMRCWYQITRWNFCLRLLRKKIRQHNSEFALSNLFRYLKRAWGSKYARVRRGVVVLHAKTNCSVKRGKKTLKRSGGGGTT